MGSCPPRPGRPDPYAQARELLTGSDIRIADAFTDPELDIVRTSTDPRLRHAAHHAKAGRIAQHLAGVPELLQRYRNAPPIAQALVHAAMDPCRLGHPFAIPYAFLKHAAPGYLSDLDWDSASDDWLEEGLAYTQKPCHGTPGPLARIRPRPGEASTSQPCYRLADYLDQTGRAERASRRSSHDGANGT